MLAENSASQSRAWPASVIRPSPAGAAKTGCQTTIASGLFAGSARPADFFAKLYFKFYGFNFLGESFQSFSWVR
jgi:hypothetical protein